MSWHFLVVNNKIQFLLTWKKEELFEGYRAAKRFKKSLENPELQKPGIQ